MKATIAIEMPDRCFDCPLCDIWHHSGETAFWCKGLELWPGLKAMCDTDGTKERATWCPLKPIKEETNG